MENSINLDIDLANDVKFIETNSIQPLYASQLSQNLMKELMDMLEKKLKNQKEIVQLFIIQYTYFELNNDIWTMKTFLDIGNETLKYIFLVISPNNKTYINVYGKNSNFGVLKIRHLLDMRRKSQYGLIYACDLYYDFVPEHYSGKCYTG